MYWNENRSSPIAGDDGDIPFQFGFQTTNPYPSKKYRPFILAGFKSSTTTGDEYQFCGRRKGL